ncbi:MAG TPA: hypothetical protein VM737_05390 [Gemmatimonadota bacterium]|nr:hypothetical protein [Gemmatimonadota bacterium]
MRYTVAFAAGIVAVAAIQACGARRILGFGDARDGILLVRHSEPVAQQVWIGGDHVGIAQPGGITCFENVPTGSVRLEARPVGATGTGVETLTRATRVTLPPEQPLLWDIDHDQILSGRAHARLCGRS